MTAGGDPKFLLIIGAAKSGTWTLASWLASRPDMAGARLKEPRFFTDFARVDWRGPGSAAFAASIVQTEGAYLAGHGAAPPGAWRVDASTDYLWAPGALERIRGWAQRFETRLICILRDPLERALSEYGHTVRDHLEPLGFEAAFAAEPERRQQNWQPLFYHCRRSRYAADVARFADAFGPDLLLMDFSELRDPPRCMARVERFLDLGPAPADLTIRKNASHGYRSARLDRLTRHPRVGAAVRALVPPGGRAMLRTALGRWNRRGAPAREDRHLAHLRGLLDDEIALLGTSARLADRPWPSLGMTDQTARPQG